jgi:GAF domain-containing protein
MRRGVVIWGVSDETLGLVAVLESNAEVEIGAVYDPDSAQARRRIESLAPETARRLLERFVDTPDRLAGRADLYAVVDGGALPPAAEAFPDAADRGIQIVSPLTARLLWGYGVSGRDRKAELLQALHEVVESVNLTVDPDELFGRMLEIAMGVTGADGGSLMLLDAERGVLTIRVAAGVERELWPKIRVPVGEGIAGRVAADARPLRLRGKADQQAFRIVRERFDVESALCVPLVHGGRVLGVLNLHHGSRPDAFSDEDLEFAEQLGRLDAEIIARAQEHEALRSQAGRWTAVNEVRRVLAGTAPLLDRLAALCRLVAERVQGGIATVYLHDADEGELRLAATSLAGGGLGGEYRAGLGHGLDGRAAETRSPVMLSGPDGSLAYAAVPLLSGGSLVGVLSVQAGNAATGWPARSRALEETLLEIGAAAADEIAHAEREARMSTRATKMGAINEAGIHLISARELSEVARLATSSGSLILEADHAILRLQDPETRRYVIRSYYGSADGRSQERLFRLDKRISVDSIKRRQSLLVRHVDREAHYAAAGSGVRSALVAPLRREGRVIGTLAFYDKAAPDQFFTGLFHEDDHLIFDKYVSYVERAVANALFFAHARQLRNFDEETSLPNAEYLARRIDQEIARAAGRAGALAVVTCRIENLDEVRRASDPIRADRVVVQTAAAISGHVRDFDVVGRTGDAEFTALLPDPGPDPEERAASLARAVAEEIAKDDHLNEPVRLALVFGCATHPADGPGREALLARARVPRIRML